MITIGEAFHTLITGAVVDIVEQRVYPVKLPFPVVLPAVTYRQIAGSRELIHGGPSNFAYPIMRVSSWATTAWGAQQLAARCRMALNGVSGPIGADPIKATILIINEMDDFTPESQTHAVVQDYQVNCEEETAI